MLEDLGTEQERIEGSDFFISYLVSEFSGDTTVLMKGTSMYILNGDWRDDYRELAVKGYKPCRRFFENKRKHYINFWSD